MFLSKMQSAALAVGVFLCLMAGWGIAARRTEVSTTQTALSHKVDYAPIRGAFRPLRLRRSGFTYKCSECHQTFKTARRYDRRLEEHADMTFEHGRNDYCLNCHHKTNRDVYVAHDGSEIPSDQPAELCRKCHGLVHRDWARGAHGRREGYWDRERGERMQLLCIQCHDPHAPRFPSLPLMPGPRVFRGGAHWIQE
jgi:hypothetical protein